MDDSLITMGLCLMLVLPVKSTYDKLKSVSQQSYASEIAASSEFFLTPESIGNVAICHAEGNCVNGKKHARYSGHKDPGNGVHNMGYCSSQKQVKSVDEANKACLERTREALPRINQLALSNNINPDKNKLFYINVVDLHNQASDWVWQNMVKYYASNQDKLKGDEAIIEARVYGFYRNGKFDATGLFNACNISGANQSENYKCIKHDQARRFKEIKGVLR
jgi:hypothetical protein